MSIELYIIHMCSKAFIPELEVKIKFESIHLRWQWMKRNEKKRKENVQFSVKFGSLTVSNILF